MKLVLHIGAGKTGSTSIQNTLKRNDQKLKEQGILYLGLMLENAIVKKYEWQKASSVVEEFHRLSDDIAKEQILDILRPTIADAQLKNIHTLVWSNESFFGRKYNFKKALKELENEGIEIELVAYVRKYDSWAKSAYVQWGIKHKTYKGRLKTFSEWRANSNPKFFSKLEILLDMFPNKLKVRNMNAVGNVAQDFISLLGVKDTSHFIFRYDNDSPSSEELLLRALFNDQYESGVLPSRFDHLFGKRLTLSDTPESYLKHLLPSTEDMKSIYQESVEDRNALNTLLISQGQEPFNDEPISVNNVTVNHEQLLLALVNIVMQQSRRIDKLERLINEKN